jgi:hypothetical protein
LFHGRHDILASLVVKAEKIPANKDPGECQPGEDAIITARI